MEVLELNDLMLDSRVNTILESAKLNWEVDRVPLVGFYKDKEIKSGYIGLTHSGTCKVLHAAKPTYYPCQNEDLVKMALKGTEAFGNLKYQKGGSINGGKKVFLQLSIDGKAEIKGDPIKRYITLINSNDGSAAVSFGYGNEVASCMNQFAKFLRQRLHKIYHNLELEEKLKKVPEILYHALQEEMRLMEIYAELAETSITKELAHKMVKHLIDIDRTMTKEELEETGIKSRGLNIMNGLYNNIDHQLKDKGENMWALFNGITKYTTHDKSVPKRLFGREESIFIGSAGSMNEKALDFVMQKAELVW